MKTPLKNPNSHSSALKELKKIIGPGKVVNSFFLYCASIEFALCNTDRFVVGHPASLAVHEFWHCMLQNAPLVYDIVKSGPFSKLRHERIITLLQEKWATYHDPFVRAALFYTLNQYSTSGKVSSGTITDDPDLFNEWKLNGLKAFKIDNFHLDSHFDPKALGAHTTGDYNLYNLGRYKQNLLHSSGCLGLEEANIDHRQINELFKKESNVPTILLYKPHPQVLRVYEQHKIRLIGKHGNIVSTFNDCEDIVVTNF